MQGGRLPVKGVHTKLRNSDLESDSRDQEGQGVRWVTVKLIEGKDKKFGRSRRQRTSILTTYVRLGVNGVDSKEL